MRVVSFFIALALLLPVSSPAQVCADMAYGIFFDGHDVDLPYFVRYSTLTGQQTILKSFPGTYVSRNGEEKGFVNVDDNTYYFMADESYNSYNTKLLSLDLATGNVKSTLALGSSYGLEYHPASHRLYAVRTVEHNFTHYFSELISIDPVTQVITVIHAFPPDTYFGVVTTVIDPVSNILYLSTHHQNTTINYDYVMLAYDLNTGTITESLPGGAMYHMVYSCTDGKIYGFANEAENGFHYCYLDLPMMTLHNITPYDPHHATWGFNGTVLINADKNTFVCYGTDEGDTTADYPNHYQYSFDLSTGQLTNVIKLTEGLANYNRHGLRFNVAWAPPSAQFSHQATCGLDMQFHSSCENSTINWNFGDPASGVNNVSSDMHPVHTFSVAGTYTITLSFTCSPGYEMTKTIRVAEKNCDGITSGVIIPNLITPNNDGSNDVFQIVDPQSRSIQLVLYNSWGGLVYQDDHYNNDWAGNNNGVYYYHITLSNPEETHEGWLHVMR